MLSRTNLLLIAAATLVVGLALPVVAEEDEPPRPSFTSLINIDALIDNHVRFLARKYDLTEDQDSFTQEFLRAKADEFLAVYRDEMFGIADRLFDVRGGGEMTQEELVAWGQRALPLYEEAKKAIVVGNDEWRQILSEEQKLVHDEDLQQMYESFAQTEEQLDLIVTGQMTVAEFRRGPRPNRSGRAPRSRSERAAAHAGDGETMDASTTPRTPRTTPKINPGGSEVGQPQPPIHRGPESDASTRRDRGSRSGARGAKPTGKVSEGFEGEWEKYVREFIEKYKLDEGQTQKAHSILKDCQDQAANVMRRAKPRLEQLEKKSKRLADTKDQDKVKALADIATERQKILEPIARIFDERLKPRLERLLTRDQRKLLPGGGKTETRRKSTSPGSSKPRKSGSIGQE